jgi:hypothetical protein
MMMNRSQIHTRHFVRPAMVPRIKKTMVKNYASINDYLVATAFGIGVLYLSSSNHQYFKARDTLTDKIMMVDINTLRWLHKGEGCFNICTHIDGCAPVDDVPDKWRVCQNDLPVSFRYFNSYWGTDNDG